MKFLIPLVLSFTVLHSGCIESAASFSEDSSHSKELPDTNDVLYRKTVPQEVAQAAREALSHYPELQKLRIEFEYDKEFHNSFMQAQPRVSSFFNSKKERVYLILMTRKMVIEDKKIPIEELPHEVLVGWFGHELGHIMDYTQRNSLGMVLFGMRYYLFDSYKIKAEREADLFAIRHGLAKEIIATKNFILSNTSLPPSYIAKIERLYLSPQGVLEIVKKIEEEKEEAIEELEEVLEDS